MDAELFKPGASTGQAARGPTSDSGRWAWTLVPIGASIVVLALTTQRSVAVTSPLLAIIWLGSAFYGSLRAEAGSAVVELGTVYAAVVSVYAIYPLLAYVANGMSYTLANDLRLFLNEPTPVELGQVAWLYAGHLAAFVLAYRLVRGNVRFEVSLQPPGRIRVVALVLLFAAISCYFLVLGQVFDLSAADYGASYLILQRLPLLLAQITNHLGGMRLPIEVAILVALFARFRRYRWVIAALLIAFGVTTFVKLWSRTEFVLLTMGALMLYHWYVRPVKERGMIFAGAIVLSLFLVAGILRSGVRESEYSAGWNIFSYSSEFESLLANAHDLQRLRSAGLVGSMPLGFYLGDVLALVPQQVSPIQKMSPADWYVSEYYPYDATRGHGYAFGTISESIVGGGIFDVLVRGTLLGVILAAVHRWASLRKATFWPVVAYTWAALLVYQSFRNTTFYLFVLFFFRFVPVVIAIEIVVGLVRGSRRWTLQRLADSAPFDR